MLACEQAGARRRADRLRAIGRRKAHPLRGEFVEIRRRLILAAIAGKIVDAEIIGEDQHDIRLFRSPRG